MWSGCSRRSTHDHHIDGGWGIHPAFPSLRVALYVSKEGTDVAYTQRFFFLLPFFPLHIPATESSHTLSIGILLTFVMQL